nr:MAG TPA: hypothetical protein [Caudoviricetes sp.]DAP97063.1 MAG TPA: hypothetical protein [Caudoviricetes sp.]
MSTLVVVTTFHSERSEGILEEISLMKRLLERIRVHVINQKSSTTTKPMIWL